MTPAGSGIIYAAVRVGDATLYLAGVDGATVGGVIDRGDCSFSWYCAHHCAGVRGDALSLDAAKVALAVHVGAQ